MLSIIRQPDLFDDIERMFGTQFPLHTSVVKTAPVIREYTADTGAYNIEVELPGYTQDDIEISSVGGQLVLEVKKREQNGVRVRDFSFTKRWTLGKYADSEITAEMKNGILHVSVDPPAEPEKRLIEVR